MELFNRFQIPNEISVDDLNKQCQKIQAFFDASKMILGHRTKQSKECIMEHSWKLVEERQATKRHLLDWRADDNDALAQEYREKNVSATLLHLTWRF